MNYKVMITLPSSFVQVMITLPSSFVQVMNTLPSSPRHGAIATRVLPLPDLDRRHLKPHLNTTQNAIYCVHISEHILVQFRVSK